MKFKIYKFKSVTSTNDKAIKLIKNKKRSGYVKALKQTNGRGTHGKKWISKEGNLFGSLFFPLQKNYPQFTEFSVINSVIISDVIKKYCKKKKVNLKFPNDIFINKKKVCGILQEIIKVNYKKFLIVGIGINIVSNPNINNRYKTTNIFIETKKKPQINEIINHIIFSYVKFFKDLKTYKYENFKKRANLMALI